jgi:hypothetical protein
MVQQQQQQQLAMCRLLHMTGLLSWRSQCLTSCGRTLTKQMMWACLSALQDIASVSAVRHDTARKQLRDPKGGRNQNRTCSPMRC